MKQIVFLISAFVVLLELHSTATADSRTEWAKTESAILSKVETTKHLVEELKQAGESAWKKANVEAPVKWSQSLTPYLTRLEGVKKEFSELIGELSKTKSVILSKIDPKINEVDARISTKISELKKKVVNAATGTKQEINVSVDETVAELENIIKTEPDNVRNILIAA